MQTLTRQQREALFRVWKRVQNETENPPSYLTFRRTTQPGWDCIMVPFAGMWLGIEKDGYTHS